MLSLTHNDLLVQPWAFQRIFREIILTVLTGNFLQTQITLQSRGYLIAVLIYVGCYDEVSPTKRPDKPWIT